MSLLTESAPAKVNLTLRVLGRRPDGYHELDSVVAFASIGDRLTLAPGPGLTLACDGPFRASIDSENSENLVLKAVHRAMAEAPGLSAGVFRLTKQLPVAAGLGGGSADAAAALRLLRRANPALAASLAWRTIAASIGADVPVCLESRAAVMAGFGERVTPIAPLPQAAIVLANPRVPLRTADVFHALAAPPITADVVPRAWTPPRNFAGLIAALATATNDLEPVARRLCPSVGAVLTRLAGCQGAKLVRMSGSGPTCFALFESFAEATTAVAWLSAHEPGWWIEPSTLG